MPEDNFNPISPKSKKSIAAIVIGVVIVLAAVVGVTMLLRPSASPLPAVSSGGNQPMSSWQKPNKTFTVTGSNFSFDPKEIRVKNGDVVRVVLKNADGFHDFVIDEFNVRTPRVNGGEQTEVTFIADKIGTFQYYCSVGEHRANGMWGNLIIQ